MLKIDHMQITVKNIKQAEAFYDKLMPVLGYSLENKVTAFLPEYDLYVVEYLHPEMDFGICSPRTVFQDETIHRRKPGAVHHIAFRAGSRREVDRVFGQIEKIGARIVHRPRIFEEHGPDYYAFFFKDPDGIKYEVVYNQTEQ